MIRLSDKLQLIGSSYLQQGMRVVTVFVMARYIGPADNGVYNAVLYAAGLAMALNDFAVPQGVVQLREFDEDVVVDTAIILSGALYGLYGLFAIGAGIYLSHKYLDPQYWRIGVIYAVSSLLAALYNVQLARLNRRLEFRAESRQNVIYAVSVAATGIVFAILHYGAYALAFQLLAGQLAANIAINFRVPLSWPRRASWSVAKRFLKLGTPASIGSYVRAVETPIIGLLIMPVEGVVGLGLWGKSIQLQQLFGQNLLSSFQRVAYPLIVNSLDDPPRTHRLFLRVNLIIMLISLLFTVVVGINAEAMIRTCLGRNWIAAAPLLRISAWAIPAGALDMVGQMVCMAVGATKSLLRVSILNLVLFIPAILVVRHFGGGLLSLAVCWSASRYLLALTMLYSAATHLHTGLWGLWKPLFRLGGAGLASAAVMVAIRMVAANVPLPIQLVVAGFVGTVVYSAVAWMIERETVMDAVRMARERSEITMNTGLDPEL